MVATTSRMATANRCGRSLGPAAVIRSPLVACCHFIASSRGRADSGEELLLCLLELDVGEDALRVQPGQRLQLTGRRASRRLADVGVELCLDRRGALHLPLS